MIKGGVTVSVDDEDSNEEIVTNVLNATKEVMANDELVTDENPEVEKVKYLDEGENNNDDEETILVGDRSERANGDPSIPVMVGASLAALVALLGVYLLKKKTSITTKGVEIEPDEEFTSPTVSFIAPDGRNLGKLTSCMDVHECKSSVCPKCYVEPRTLFIPSQQFPQTDVASFPQLSCVSPTRTIEALLSSDESDSSP